MPRRRTANEDLFALVLRHWQSLPSEREKASFFVEVVLRDERFTDLLPFMVDAALRQLDQDEVRPPRGSRSKISGAKDEQVILQIVGYGPSGTTLVHPELGDTGPSPPK